MEYTFLAAGLLLAAMVLVQKNRPFLLHSRVFWLALATAAGVQLVADNVTVWKGFWIFNVKETLGVVIPFMPLENLLFGISLFVFSVLAWEHMNSEKKFR